MAGRNRAQPPPPFPRGGGHPPPSLPHHHPHPHAHRLDEFREPPPPQQHHLQPHPFPGRGGAHPPPPPSHLVAALEERLAGEIEEAHALLAGNQRLAATHVALVQEVAAARHELDRASRALAAAQDDGDLRLREVYERAMKMEAELGGVEDMRAELVQVRGDVQKLNAARQELMGQVQVLTQDLARSSVDLQQVAALKAEIQEIRRESEHMRSGIELEKKGYAESYKQGQEMQKNLISVASEVEKLRAEAANADRRARAAVAMGNQGYGGNYGNPKPNYAVNSYNAGYNMNQIPSAADASSQYGPGTGHNSWGGYDMQRAPGRR